ncbi:MAG: sensor histidine kinase [Cyanobacteria bacterium HKST-UBA03]|nr:sensor histidine kinase [Cyanobacteria bacterium HKST-UBA03]
MSRNPASIRRQLLWWIMLPLAGVILLSLGTSYLQATRYANIAFDAELAENARAMAGQVINDHGRWRLASPQLSATAFEQPMRDQVLFLMTHENGQVIGGDKRLAQSYLSNTYPAFEDRVIDDNPMRMVTVKIPVRSTKPSPSEAFILIQMAETLNERQVLTQQILINTLVHQLALALLMLLFVWWGVTRGLRPLERLGDAIAAQSPGELHPVDETNVPQEVLPLTKTINTLMTNLKGYIEIQKRFTANTAHQLRTPLAGLQTQLEVACRQTTLGDTQHALAQMQVSLDQTIHLTQQLLSLAKAEPRPLASLTMTPVNLTDMLKNVVESFIQRAGHKQIDLGYEGPDEALMIEGVEDALQEMVVNLVDNALHYTPEGGQVTVTLSQHPEVTIGVEDTGPGIPAAEREQVFERFYRLHSSDTPGSGLGLAIVHEIAQTHHAQVTITDGENNVGTKVTVTFEDKF